MRPRGTALGIAIVCVLLVAGVGTLLVRSYAARVQSRRADVKREAALRHAEAALVVARTAVEQDRLKPGAQMQAEGLTVQCEGLNEGVTLTTTCEAPLTSGVTPSTLQRLLHVTWKLEKKGKQWRLTGWSTARETRNMQPSAEKREPAQ